MTSMKMKFKRVEILKTLQENRKNHLEIVREAQVGYREKIQKVLEESLEKIKNGKSFNPFNAFRSIVVPENHIDDYDRTIQMLQMCVEDNIELSADEFQCYVRDQWGWMGNFLLSNTGYSKKAFDYSTNFNPNSDE